VREPLSASSATRVQFPLAKTPICGSTCPSSPFRRADDHGLSGKVPLCGMSGFDFRATG